MKDITELEPLWVVTQIRPMSESRESPNSRAKSPIFLVSKVNY